MRRERIPTIVPMIAAMLAIGLMSAVAPADDRASTPLYEAEDLDFLRHMIVHHEQALAMASLVPERTDRQEFIRFAGYVHRAQAAEIEVMQSLLDLAAERGLEVPEHVLHGDPPMAGMLSAAEMDALAAASGAEFERLWLEGMIYHHEGALGMASAQQRRQFESGRRPYGIDVLVEDILVEQLAEITRMRAWLGEWGLASIDGATHPEGR